MANTQWDGTDGRAEDRSADRPDRAAPLEPGQGTVGSHIDVRHVAGTPIGMRVTSRATLTQRDGRRLVFRVQADDERERVGEATHERFVVEMQRFMGRIATKGR
jgi:predicted thioesterase